MHIHILGICGTFMAGIAQIAKLAGFSVSGCDSNVYPPMSELLEDLDIDVIPNFNPDQLSLKPDCFIIGNAISRGNPLLEAILSNRLAYTSGPQWLYEHVLSRLKVIAITGTHGKTTTASMVTHILQQSGISPGFLIGGVCQNLNRSAQLGQGDYFVIEADEYDTAFFDKRPKFLHYNPLITVINNLEFDHADIYESLADIEKQFHHLIRRIPSNGIIIRPHVNQALDRVCSMGCWTPVETMSNSENSTWRYEARNQEVSKIEVFFNNESHGIIDWKCFGSMNAENALAAIAACYHAGVDVSQSCSALGSFKPVKRRLELKSSKQGIQIYDDFAHHPTAINNTLTAIRNKVGSSRVIAVIEFGSYSMKHGVFAQQLKDACKKADMVYALRPDCFEFEYDKIIQLDSVDSIVETLSKTVKSNDTIVIMSNKNFGNIHQKLLQNIC